MNLEWSREALADLNRFATFLSSKHPALVERAAQEILSRAEILADHPQLGRPLAGREEYRQIILQVLNAR